MLKNTLQRHATPRVVFSGIQPTGIPHIGNHLGALSQWQQLVKEQRTKEVKDKLFFSVVGLHALTVPQDPIKLLQERREMFAVLLALGLNPSDKEVDVTVFHQDMVPQHSELAWYLNCVTSVGRLLRMTSWKSKLATIRNSNSEEEIDESLLQLGLLAYPVLQAADILLYKTTHVPVGNDQSQHLELCRDLAESFNRQYPGSLSLPPSTSSSSSFSITGLNEGESLLGEGGGEEIERKKKRNRGNKKKKGKGVFKLPEVMLATHPRIQSLRDPLSKMSKSSPNPLSILYMTDPPSTISSKIKSAVTDSILGVTWDPDERPGVANLLKVHSGYSGESVESIADRFKGERGIMELKGELVEVVSEGLRGFRGEFERLKEERGYLEKMERLGADKAKEVAEGTMKEVRRAVGTSSTA